MRMISRCFSSTLVLGVAVVVGSASQAAASPITSPADLAGATTTINFSQFTGGSQLSGVNGPVQIGALVGLDVTVQDLSGGSNVWLYNANWGLLDNGFWDSGRNGFLGIFPNGGPVRIRFNSGAVSGFGLFMNYPTPGFLPQTLSAYDSSGNLLETFDVGANSPINTPGATNAGAFRGIQLGSANIAYVDIFGDTAVFDDLTFTQVVAPTAVPEPASMFLLGTGIVGICTRRRNRRQRD